MRHDHETCQNTDYFLKCRSEVKFSGMTIYLEFCGTYSFGFQNLNCKSFTYLGFKIIE